MSDSDTPTEPFGASGRASGEGPRPPVRDVVREVIRYRAFCESFGDDPELLTELGIERPRLGQYALDKVLGAGAKGAVLGGVHLKLGRAVAVKVVRQDLDPALRSADEMARLLREAQSLARLNHDNVVQVYDAADEDGLVYIAMAHVQGKTLREAQAGKAWQELVALYLDAARGLDAAHSQNIIHRDFKADNVLVGEDGLVKVADFGLATLHTSNEGPKGSESGGRRPHDRATHPDMMDARITQAGQSHGTPAYMPPEQFEGDADARSDVYAFCASLFEALYGALPFPSGDGWIAAYSAKLGDEPRRRPAGSRVPRWLDRLLRRGLKAKPEERPQSMAELLVQLDYRARRRRMGLGLASTAFVGVFAALILTAMAPDPCEAGPDQLADAWGPSARQDLLARTDGPARARAERVAGLLDGKADAWIGTFGQVCAATTHDGTQSQELHDVRMACLHQRKLELREVVDRVREDPSAASLATAIEVAARLPSPQACAQESRVPRPSEGDKAAVDAIAARLAEVEVAELAGDYQGSLALAEGVARDAEAVAYIPARVYAQMALGRLRWETQDRDGAALALDAALALAESNSLDPLAADASNLLTKVAGLMLHDAVRGEEWAKQTERKIARISRWTWHSRTFGDPWRTAELLNNRGVLADDALADYPVAADFHRQALALRERLPGDARLLIADSHLNLGRALFKQGQLEAAKEHTQKSIEINREVLGDDHPRVAEGLFNYAVVLMNAGLYDEAVSIAEDVLVVDERAIGGPRCDSTNAHNLLSHLHERRLDLPRALIHARSYAEILDKCTATPAEHAMALERLACVLRENKAYEEANAVFQHALEVLPGGTSLAELRVRASLLNNRGSAHVNRADYAAAHADFDAALATLADQGPGQDDVRASIYKGIGRAYVHAERYPESVAPLEQALALAEERGDEALIAEIKSLLATADVRGELDSDRGRQLAREALAYFTRVENVEYITELQALLGAESGE